MAAIVCFATTCDCAIQGNDQGAHRGVHRSACSASSAPQALLPSLSFPSSPSQCVQHPRLDQWIRPCYRSWASSDCSTADRWCCNLYNSARDTCWGAFPTALLCASYSVACCCHTPSFRRACIVVVHREQHCVCSGLHHHMTATIVLITCT